MQKYWSLEEEKILHHVYSKTYEKSLTTKKPIQSAPISNLLSEKEKERENELKFQTKMNQSIPQTLNDSNKPKALMIVKLISRSDDKDKDPFSLSMVCGSLDKKEFGISHQFHERFSMHRYEHWDHKFAYQLNEVNFYSNEEKKQLQTPHSKSMVIKIFYDWLRICCVHYQLYQTIFIILEPHPFLTELFTKQNSLLVSFIYHHFSSVNYALTKHPIENLKSLYKDVFCDFNK